MNDAMKAQLAALQKVLADKKPDDVAQLKSIFGIVDDPESVFGKN